MAFPGTRSYNSVLPITGLVIPPLGMSFRTPRVYQGPSRGLWIYNFYLTGTSTPVNVYQDGAMTNPFSPTGVVTADAYGRFPAIYLDNSVTYKVQLLNASAVVQRTTDPYYPPLATTGFSQESAAIGMVISSYGEVTVTEASSGGSGIEAKVNAGLGGALKLQGTTPGSQQITINNSVTTGTFTANFQAANRPGNELQYTVTATAAPAGGAYGGGTLTANFTGTTASTYTIVLSTGQVILGCTFTNGSTTFTCPSTSITGSPSATFVVTFSTGVAGWLPIQCDGTLYYMPLFHGNQFTPYRYVILAVNTPTINAGTITFNTNGTFTNVGGSYPGNWYLPTTTGIGSTYYLNVTYASGVGSIEGITLGSWVSLGSAQYMYAADGPVTGTYQISTTASLSGLVGTGSLSLGAATNSVQALDFNTNTFSGGGSSTADMTTMTFNTNGTSAWGKSGTPNNWYLPTTTGIGSSYWIKATLLSGSYGSYTGPTLGSWVSMASVQTLSVSGVSNAVFQYQISSASGGSPIVAQGQIQLINTI